VLSTIVFLEEENIISRRVRGKVSKPLEDLLAGTLARLLPAIFFVTPSTAAQHKKPRDKTKLARP
jgi:hypothetical protein